MVYDVPKREFKYILFDLDGTLTDPYEGISKSINYALERLGEPLIGEELIRKFIGPPLREGYMQNLGFNKEKAEKAVNIYRERYCVTGIYENILIDGVKELLNSLRSRGKVIVTATLKPQDLAECVLRHFGIFEFFYFVSGADFDFNKLNTKTEIIKRALDSLGIKTAEQLNQTIMIGDRHHDIEGAFNNGISSMGVLVGYGSRAELEKAGACYIVENISDIEKFI